MLGIEALPWSPYHFPPGTLRRERGMVDWIRFTLQQERSALERVGIYHAVFLSLFEYTWDLSFFQALAERWRFSSNTVILEDRELTISPVEFQRMSGLPIFGAPYDEYTPTIEALRQRSSEGMSIYPSSLLRLFDIYHRLARVGDVTFSVWISHFTDRVRHPCQLFARTSIPFGVGGEMIFHTGGSSASCYSSHRIIGRDTVLAAFLAWWLCYFVIPSRPEGIIRPDTFIVASRLARGDLISLTIPALANLFKCMRVISTSRDPSFCDEVIPYHYLFGWVHMYWAGLYSPIVGDTLLSVLPTLIEIAGARAIRIPERQARALLRHSGGYLRLAYGRQYACHEEQSEDLILFDGGPGGDHHRGLILGSPQSGFFISLRHGLLPLRLGDRVVLEPYMPHRCAHQFGLDQSIPADVPSADDICADLEGAVRCWSSFLRVETQARFLMPRPFRYVAFSVTYERWFRDMVRSCYMRDLDHWIREVLPGPGDHVGTRTVPPFVVVSGLQSRDSRFFGSSASGPSGIGMFAFKLYLSLYSPLFQYD
jgi:hypothetical protein